MALEIRPDHREEDEFYRNYTRYLIGIGFISQKDGEEAKTHFFSGFLMEFGDDWFWVTAGHILNVIDALPNAERFILIDSFGSGPNEEAMPFDYANAWRYAVDDDAAGLDFGVVQLPKAIQKRLRDNEAVAVRVSEWQTADFSQHGSYVMVGLAFDSIFRTKFYGKDGYVLRGKPKPNLIWTDVGKPPWHDPGATHPRLIATVGGNYPVGDIMGMSGGPIFGVTDDELPLPLVAVQSAWYVEERVIVACPIHVFAPMLAKRIREAPPPSDSA